MGLFSMIKNAVLGPSVDYKEVVNKGGVIVDVRTPGEFNGGHAKGSINIPLQSLSSKIKSLKGKEVVLVCRSGARAGQAKAMLQKEGITAYNAGPWQRMA